MEKQTATIATPFAHANGITGICASTNESKLGVGLVKGHQNQRHDDPSVIRPDPCQHRLQGRVIMEPVTGLLVRGPERVYNPLIGNSGEFLFPLV